MNRVELLNQSKGIVLRQNEIHEILEERRTNIQRIVKPQPKYKLSFCIAASKKSEIGKWGYADDNVYKYWGEEWKRTESLSNEDKDRKWVPPYHADDILYVRETFGRRLCSECDNIDCIQFDCQQRGFCYQYKADDAGFVDKWHPSVQMPKSASRIFLRVTNVTVERLQEASIKYADNGSYNTNTWNSFLKQTDIDLYGWNANPWVWVIEFKRLEVK